MEVLNRNTGKFALIRCRSFPSWALLSRQPSKPFPRIYLPQVVAGTRAAGLYRAEVFKCQEVGFPSMRSLSEIFGQFPGFPPTSASTHVRCVGHQHTLSSCLLLSIENLRKTLQNSPPPLKGPRGHNFPLLHPPEPTRGPCHLVTSGLPR